MPFQGTNIAFCFLWDSVQIYSNTTSAERRRFEAKKTDANDSKKRSGIIIVAGAENWPPRLRGDGNFVAVAIAVSGFFFKEENFPHLMYFLAQKPTSSPILHKVTELLVDKAVSHQKMTFTHGDGDLCREETCPRPREFTSPHSEELYVRHSTSPKQIVSARNAVLFFVKFFFALSPHRFRTECFAPHFAKWSLPLHLAKLHATFIKSNPSLSASQNATTKFTANSPCVPWFCG